MKRAARIVMTMIAGASLLLCITVAVLWARGYYVGEAFQWNLPQRGDSLADGVFSLHSGCGGLCFRYDQWASWELGVRKPTRTAQHRKAFAHATFRPYYPYVLNAAWVKVWGFEWSGHDEPISPTSVGSGVILSRNVTVPCWAAFAATALLPGWQFARRRRAARRWQYRRQHGLCIVCGYDLRATRAGRCPECGTEIAMALALDPLPSYEEGSLAKDEVP